MRLGLITDIHEEVDRLRIAIDRLRSQQVDQILMLGDIVEMGRRLRETCQLLTAANVVGVWGNHDFGLCVAPHDQAYKKYGEVVTTYMASLHPSLVVEDCYFAHIEPWLNPQELDDLWHFEGPPNEESQLARIFNAVPNRLMFAGHYHKWMLVSRDGVADWDGRSPVRLGEERHFVVIGALCQGSCAVLDTESSVLTPFNGL